MHDEQTRPSKYVVLIGINAYQSKPLKGCVSDVRSIKDYLDGTRYPIDIQIFTAAGGTDLGSSLTEEPGTWPTYENVTSALNRVTTLAASGDYVYIHFSGHGTRKSPRQTTGDLALVLLDGNRETYWWSSDLASCLKIMVDNGLVVTLILDCCFSASMNRHDDSEIRFLAYNAEFDQRPISDAEAISGNVVVHTAERDVGMYPSWLVNPSGYAVLAACGPHEEAIEPRFDGQRRGALSYFLLDALRRRGVSQSHKYLHDYIRSKFRKARLPPNPVLYGTKSQGFFGYIDREIDLGVVPIVVGQDRKLELQAGTAHGVKECDTFRLSPVVPANYDVESQDALVVAEVIRVGPLTAELKLRRTSIEPRTGWMATALTRLALHEYPVRLDASLPHQLEWLAALRQRMPYMNLKTDHHRCTFSVVYNNDKEYEVLDEVNRSIPYLPPMTLDPTGFIYLGDLIQHLARYKQVKDLVNSTVNTDFRNSFDIRMIGISGEVFVPDNVITVEQNEHVRSRIELQVENKWHRPLYINVYDIGPCWQVQDILRESHKVVPPKGIQPGQELWTQRLKSKVPNALIEEGYRECEDIVKVIVSSQASSFDMLELPELGHVTQRKTLKGKGRGGDQIPEDWIAVNFIVRTSLSQ